VIKERVRRWRRRRRGETEEEKEVSEIGCDSLGCGVTNM
jgi:hypothetical protein